MAPGLTPLPNDASGTLVSSWVEALLPSLAELFETTTTSHGTVEVHDCEIISVRVDEVAWRCAVEIAADRLRYYPTKFFNWFGALAETCEIDIAAQERAAERLRVDVGVPGAERSDSHLCGLVGETLLGGLLRTQDRGAGLPVLFEGHDWSVTDPGGDCLAVYGAAENLTFHLWECKSIHGATATGTVIKGAAEQLQSRAAEYLGRFAPVAQRSNLPTGASDFILSLSDLWHDDDASKSAGIAVATHRAKCTANSFSQIHAILDIPAARTHGNYTSAPDFLAFSCKVRASIWKGCGLV